jgi:hypothetical protein
MFACLVVYRWQVWYARAAMNIVAGVGDLLQKTGNGHIGRVLGGQTIESSGDTVCGLHRARVDKERVFLSLALKSLGRFVSGLSSKPLGRFVSGLTSKPLRWFLPV